MFFNAFQEKLSWYLEYFVCLKTWWSSRSVAARLTSVWLVLVVERCSSTAPCCSPIMSSLTLSGTSWTLVKVTARVSQQQNPFYIILWLCWTNVNVKFNFCIFLLLVQALWFFILVKETYFSHLHFSHLTETLFKTH